MLHVQCPGCGTFALIECSCPPGLIELLGFHRESCSHFDIGANVTCPPDSGCCQEEHSHDAHANSCRGNHAGVKCPDEDPYRCPVWLGMVKDAYHPLNEGFRLLPDPGPCPGEHCHLDIAECAVCRPVIITVPENSVRIQAVAA